MALSPCPYVCDNKSLSGWCNSTVCTNTLYKPKCFAMFDEPINGVNQTTLIRKSATKIEISTLNPLTDDQMSDMYWLITAMSQTGKRLKDLMGENNER